MIDLASCGFYRINGIVYFDKIHAMEVAKKTGQEIEFDFNKAGIVNFLRNENLYGTFTNKPIVSIIPVMT